MRKLFFFLCKYKGADQLCSNSTAHQRLCFRYTDSAIPLLGIPQISRFLLSTETIEASLCRTMSETPKTGLFALQLILNKSWIMNFPEHIVVLLECVNVKLRT